MMKKNIYKYRFQWLLMAKKGQKQTDAVSFPLIKIFTVYVQALMNEFAGGALSIRTETLSLKMHVLHLPFNV